MSGTRTIVGSFHPGAGIPAGRPLCAHDVEFEFEGGPMRVAATGSAGRFGSTVCVLDGHLFNGREVESALGAPPDCGDEELVQLAHRRWGAGALARLRGEFVAFIWSADRGEGLLARDRSGARAIFYLQCGRELFFASELGELLAMLPSRPAPDEIALARALGGWTTHDGRTLYEGVRRLPPGGVVAFRGSGFEVAQFWTPTFREADPMSKETATERIKQLIGESVRERAAARANAGVRLSGGLDSSTVAAIGARALGREGRGLRGYSAEFPDVDEADESRELDLLADSMDVSQVRMSLVGGSPLSAGLQFLERWQVPLGPPNQFVWQPMLQRAAEEGIEVMLDGDGGDEIFSASRHLIADEIRRGRLVEGARLARRIPGAGSDIRSVARSLVEWGVDGLLPPGLSGRKTRHSPILRPATASLFQAGEEAEPWRSWAGPRWWAQKAHSLVVGPESFGSSDYYRRAATMAGLRFSHPLMDTRLIDLMLSLPPKWSFDPVFTRPLLRAAGKGLVPDAVRLKRRKARFWSVFTRPMMGPDFGLVKELLGDPRAEVFRHVDPETVQEELLRGPRGNPRGEAAWALESWRTVNVECWLRAQADPHFVRDLQEKVDSGASEARTFFVLDAPPISA